MASRKILVVEDDPNLMPALEAALKEEGFEVVCARDGIEALKAMQRELPDLVILDLKSSWLGRIPGHREVPAGALPAGPSIVVVGAGEADRERIQALDAAVDDYVIKPFGMKDLIARIKAIQPRTPSAASGGILRAGLIEMDLDRRTVLVEGKAVTLATKEFGLLRMLFEAKGRVLTRAFLRENVWKEEKAYRFDTRTVDVHVGRLRHKLGPAGRYIITVRGVGYRFDVLPDWI